MKRITRVLALLLTVAMTCTLTVPLQAAGEETSEEQQVFFSEDFEGYEAQNGYLTAGSEGIFALTGDVDAAGRSVDIKQNTDGNATRFARLNNPNNNKSIRVTPDAQARTIAGDFTISFRMRNAMDGGATTVDMRTVNNTNTRLLILWGDGRLQTTAGVVQEGDADLVCDPEKWYDLQIRVRITGKDTMVYDVYRREAGVGGYELIARDVPGASGGDYNNGMKTFQFDMSGANATSWFGLDNISLSRAEDADVMAVTMRNFQSVEPGIYTGDEAAALGAYNCTTSAVSVEEENGMRYLKIAPSESTTNDPGIYLLKGNTVPGRVAVEARVRLSNMVTITENWHGHLRALAKFNGAQGEKVAQMLWMKETRFATGSGNGEASNLFLGDGTFQSATNGAEIFDHTADTWYWYRFEADPATRHMVAEVRDDAGNLLFSNDWIAWNTDFTDETLTELFLQQPYTNAGGGVKRRTDISVSEIRTYYEADEVAVTVGPNGTLTDGGNEVQDKIAVQKNGSKELLIVPDSGYILNTVEVTGANHTLEGNLLTLSGVGEGASVSVTFKKEDTEANTEVEVLLYHMDFEEYDIADDCADVFGNKYVNNGPSPKSVDIKNDDPARSKYARLNNVHTGESMRIFPAGQPADTSMVKGDYTIEFSIKNAAEPGDDIGTLLFNMRTPTNKATEFLRLWNNGKMAVSNKNGGRQTLSSPLYERDSWYDFKMDITIADDKQSGSYYLYWRKSGETVYTFVTDQAIPMHETEYGAGICIPLFDYTGGSASSWLGLDDFLIYQREDFAVTSVDPVNNAQEVPLNPTITIDMNSTVDAQSVNAETVKLEQNGQAVSLSYAVEDKRITATPQTPLVSAAAYTLTVDGVKAGNGAVTAQAFSSTFTTVNNAPIATDVTIEAPVMATDETITGSYQYSCVNPEAGSTFRWLRSTAVDGEFTEITGATQKTYTLTPEDEGKYLKFEVTPKSDTAPTDGSPVQSTAVLGPVPPEAADVRLSAGAIVGRSVEGQFTYSDKNSSPEGTHLYQWYLADSADAEPAAIAGQTGKSITVEQSYEGKYLLFGVTPVSSQKPYQGIQALSQPVLVTSTNSAPAAGDVAISGTPSVGSLIEGTYTFTDPDGDEEGSSVYAWLISDSADGGFEPIAGQAAKQLLISEDQEGKYIKFSITPKDLFGLAGAEAQSDPVLVEQRIPNALYVSNSQGSDENDGSFEHPFATLEKARDTIRAYKDQGLTPKNGWTVYVRGGTYQLTQSFSLTEQDAATADAPTVYRPYRDEKVILSGGVDIDYGAFSPVEGEMKALLRVPEARNKVLVADLAEIGLSDYAGIPIINDAPAAPLVMFDGEQMILSRYPNSQLSDDWPLEYVGNSYPGTNPGTAERFDPDADPVPFTVAYTDDVISTWTHNVNKIITFGYWYASWYGEARYLASINAANKTFTSQRPAFYGVSNGRPFCMMNVYEELDMLGEWYIDETARKMYIYPFDVEGGANPVIHMTKQEFDLVSISGADHVTVQGFDITMGRENGVAIRDSENVIVRDCEISVFEKFGGIIEGGKNCGFDNCEIQATGTGGVDITGGEDSSLTPGGHFVNNSEIHNFTLIKKSYAPAVYLKGVGNTASHNEIYNCDHAAIIFEGPDMVIEYNHFYDIGHNSTDMGAVYAGRSLLRMGTEIRYNYFENLGSTFQGTHGMQSVFLDDGLSGTLIHHNVFGEGSGPNFATKIYGGQENYFTNNLYLNTALVHFNQSFGNATWSRIMNGDKELVGEPNKLDGSYGALYGSLLEARENPLYVARWPWLAQTGTEAGNQYKSNVLENNVFAFIDVAKDKNYVNYYHEQVLGLTNNTVIEGNTAENKAQFVDYEGGDYTIRPGSALAKERPGVASIPFQEIGRKAVENQLPEARNVSITGQVAIGGILTGSYEYFDSERDLEGATQLLWLVSSTENGDYVPVEGAQGNVLQFSQELSGKFIKFRVIPSDEYGNAGVPYDSEVLRAIADKESLLALIEQMEADTDTAAENVGEDLGQYPQKAVDDMREAIDQARATYGEESATIEDLVEAANLLSETYAVLQQARITTLTLSDGAGSIDLPENLSRFDLNIPNLTGAVTLNISDGRLPPTTVQATIGGKQITVTFAQDTDAPAALLLIEALDESSVQLFGDVYSRFAVGNAGETYEPLRILVTGAAGRSAIYIADGKKTTITNPLTSDAASALQGAPYGVLIAGDDLVIWTTLGGEYAVADLVNPSDNALLKEVYLDGKRFSKFRENTFSYTYSVSALPTVTAETQDAAATVEVQNATELPGTATITVTAQAGNKQVYTLHFTKKESPTSNPTYYPQIPATGNDSGNTGGLLLGLGNNTPTQGRFTDTAGHWAEADIADMAARGIVTGVTATTFEPDRNITRAEFATLIVKALKLNSNTPAGFSDVGNGEWHYPYVNAAANAGLIAGYDGQFRPDDPITREEMAVIIARTYSFLGHTPQSGSAERFSDRDDISDWAYPSVDTATSAGLIAGMTVDTFVPQENATRAQAASILKRLLDI